MKKNEIQNAPYEQNATAPNVFPVRNSQIPAIELGDAAVGEREAGHHRQQAAAGQTAVADQAGVDHAQHEGGPGERGQAQRAGIGGRPASHPSARGLGRGRHVGLARPDVCGFHLILLMRG